MLHPLHQHLKQVTGNEDVSASCPQPGNSLITFRGLNEWDTCLSGCVKERAHALVTLSGSRCGISAVLNPNCLKEIIIKKASHLQMLDWSPPECQETDLERTGPLKCRCTHRRNRNVSSELSTPSSKIPKNNQPNTHWDESMSSVLVLSCSKQFMKTCKKTHTMWKTNYCRAHLSLYMINWLGSAQIRFRCEVHYCS